MAPLPNRPALTSAWKQGFSAIKNHQKTILSITVVWLIFHLLSLGIIQLDIIYLPLFGLIFTLLSGVLSVFLWVYAHHKTMNDAGKYLFSGKPISSTGTAAWLATQHVLALAAAILAYTLVLFVIAYITSISPVFGLMLSFVLMIFTIIAAILILTLAYVTLHCVSEHTDILSGIRYSREVTTNNIIPLLLLFLPLFLCYAVITYYIGPLLTIAHTESGLLHGLAVIVVCYLTGLITVLSVTTVVASYPIVKERDQIQREKVRRILAEYRAREQEGSKESGVIN